MNDSGAMIRRRELLQGAGLCLGGLALASLLAESSPAAPDDDRLDQPLSATAPHFAPRATSVIFLHMVGAPSQLDLFDFKPKLQELDGQPCPEELLAGKRFAFLRGRPKMMGTKFSFARHGECGMEISELLPHLSRHADRLTLLKAVQTEQFNHAPAQLFLQTGAARFGRPSIGAWVNYGLGSENRDLPGFVVLITGQVAGAGNSLWGSGFLPSRHQGVEFRGKGDPVLFLSNPPGVLPEDRRRIIDQINRLNQSRLADVGDPEIATRISQYELAFRMQSSAPELIDLSGETQETLDLYGASPEKPSFANHCLLARRLVERGVRFVQLYDEGWDHHGAINTALPKKCQEVDKPIAGLLTDLARRGLLDRTLVIWGGEFGRTPMLQSDREAAGRDHHKEAFCMWMAGGGARPGATIGKTDELGYFPVEQAVHVHDVQATLLHLLGIDHQRLTFKHQGRPFRLTDIGGEVIHQAIA